MYDIDVCSLMSSLAKKSIQSLLGGEKTHFGILSWKPHGSPCNHNFDSEDLNRIGNTSEDIGHSQNGQKFGEQINNTQLVAGDLEEIEVWTRHKSHGRGVVARLPLPKKYRFLDGIIHAYIHMM